MNEEKIPLTDEEQNMEERDQALMAVVRSLNDSQSTSITNIFPQAQPMAELQYWAEIGNLGKVKIALNNGAEINAVDEYGYTALHSAAENGHLEVVKLLVEQGADVNIRTQDGKTAAELAEAENPNVVAYLQTQ